MSHIYCPHDRTDGADLPGPCRCQSAGALDRLVERDGQTLGEMCGYLPQMTRFGVMNISGSSRMPGSYDLEGRREAPLPQPRSDPSCARPPDQQVRRPVVGTMSALKSRPGDPDGHLRPRLLRLHQGLAGPGPSHHRRRRYRPLLLRDARRLRIRRAGAPLDETLLATAPPAADGKVLEIKPGRRLVDVLPPAVAFPVFEIPGPDPDVLGGRAHLLRAARSSPSPAR